MSTPSTALTTAQKRVVAYLFQERNRPTLTADQVRDGAGVVNARTVLHHLTAKGVLVESFEGWSLSPSTRTLMVLALQVSQRGMATVRWYPPP